MSFITSNISIDQSTTISVDVVTRIWPKDILSIIGRLAFSSMSNVSCQDKKFKFKKYRADKEFMLLYNDLVNLRLGLQLVNDLALQQNLRYLEITLVDRISETVKRHLICSPSTYQLTCERIIQTQIQSILSAKNFDESLSKIINGKIFIEASTKQDIRHFFDITETPLSDLELETIEKEVEPAHSVPAFQYFDAKESFTLLMHFANQRIKDATLIYWSNMCTSSQGPQTLEVGHVRDALLAGANPNAVIDGKFPLLFCSNVHVVKMLVEYGAIVNRRDSQSQTPLHKAILGRFRQVEVELKKAGAHERILDRSGKKPSYYTASDKGP
jgi:hypothetical protein